MSHLQRLAIQGFPAVVSFLRFLAIATFQATPLAALTIKDLLRPSKTCSLPGESVESGGKGALQSSHSSNPIGFRCFDGQMKIVAHVHLRIQLPPTAFHEDPVAVKFVLRLIGKLYHWESQWNEKKLKGVEQRSALRCSHFALLLNLLSRVVQALDKRTRPTSNLGKAYQYMMRQWKKLLSR